MDCVSQVNHVPLDGSPDLSGMIKAIADKDHVSLEILYETCRRGIFSLAYSITRDMQRSEDVLQETMLYIWDHAANYKFDRNPKGWIFLIARHISVDQVRNNRNLVSIDEYVDKPVPRELTTDAGIEADVTIRMGIDRLDDLEAQVFVLKTIVGLSHSETAELLQISYRSVRYRYRCAIAQLKEVLSE